MKNVNFDVIYEMMKAEITFSSEKEDLWGYTVKSP